MRKKIFSALLLSMLAFASTSTLVSCKDYDDDISANTSAINDLKGKLTELQTNLSNQLSTLQGQLTTAKTELQNAIDKKADKTTVETLAGQVSTLEANVGKIQTKLNSLDETLKTKADKDAVNDALALKADQSELEAKYAALTGEISKTNTNVATLKKAVEDNLDIQKKVNENVEKRLKALEEMLADYPEVKAQVAANKTAIASLDEDVNDLYKKVNAITDKVLPQLYDYYDGEINKLNEKINAVSSDVNALEVFVTKLLRSLVLEPDFYYQGIQAFEVATYDYTSKTVNAVNADGDFKEDKPTAAAAVSMVPDMNVTYHMNPSNAAVSTEATCYSFVSFDRQYRTQAEPLKIEVYKAAAANGKVTVTAKVKDATLIKTNVDHAAGTGTVTVAALQYTEKEATITSDYAAITKNAYKDFVLNNPKLALQHPSTHLFDQASQAIADNARLIEIAWNGTLDLREYVNTHRSNETEADVQWDANAKAGDVEKAGFKYSFQIVGYHAGDNKTSESAHLALNNDGYTVRAQMPKDGKQQAYGAEQNKAEIGRMPLVRVLLTDTINNKIAAVGYIKLKIVDVVTPDEEIAQTVEYGPYTDAYTVKCDGDVLTKTLTWYEIEEKLIAKLAISKQTFETEWELDGTTVGQATKPSLFYQYKSNAYNAEKVATDFGKVEQTTADVDGHMTEVIKWTVSNTEAYNYFSTGTPKPTSKTVYVRYKKKGATEVVYVALTWTPSAINIDPTASLADADKIKQYWYAHNTASHTGYAEIHGNVEVVGQADANDEYIFDVKNTFVGNVLKLSNLDAVYNDLKTSNDYQIFFKFVTPTVTEVEGNDGKTYVLSVTTDGQKLQANEKGKADKFDVATINTGAVKAATDQGGIITFASNDVAKALLNNADHNELADGETLTGRIAVEVKTCDPAGKITLTNNEFDVKFLRPVSVTGASANFVDATTGGSIADITATFTDWRDHNFTNAAQTKDADYFKYYGVKQILVDTDNITTDLNDGNIDTQKLSEVTTKIKFSFVEPTGNGTQIVANKYGKLKYENNGTTVGAFNIKVPVTFVYDWGKIKTYINGTISETIANGAKKVRK